jgi:menaquinone-dependent protoporphyrinogen oxidase
MARVAVLYGTTDGHTAKIAHHVADAGERLGHRIEVHRLDDLPPDFSLQLYDGVLVGASIHAGKHQPYVVRFVTEHRDALKRLPSGFFSVGLSSAWSDPESRAQAHHALEQFCDQTGWMPDRRLMVAGALRYTRYGLIKRLMMRFIVKRAGGPTDVSKDYEFTHWDEVDRFLAGFFELVAPRPSPRPSPTA